MTEIPEEALNFLKKDDLDIAFGTVNEKNEPNVVPINNLWIKDSQTLLVGDVFFKKTRDNLKETKKAVISYWKGTTGFQVKGEVEELISSGELFEEKKEELKKHDLDLDFLVVIKSKEVYATTPGSDAGEKLT